MPCHKVFIAHYEHALADPQAFVEPLALFLQLAAPAREALRQRLGKNGKAPSRKAHKLTQYSECRAQPGGGGKALAEDECYRKVSQPIALPRCCARH